MRQCAKCGDTNVGVVYHRRSPGREILGVGRVGPTEERLECACKCGCVWDEPCLNEPEGAPGLSEFPEGEPGSLAFAMTLLKYWRGRPDTYWAKILERIDSVLTAWGDGSQYAPDPTRDAVIEAVGAWAKEFSFCGVPGTGALFAAVNGYNNAHHESV